MTPVGFEPAQLALVELESTHLDHSGKVCFAMLRYAMLCYAHLDHCAMLCYAMLYIVYNAYT